MNRQPPLSRRWAACVLGAATLCPALLRAEAPTAAVLRVDGSAAASPLSLNADAFKQQFGGSLQTVNYQSHDQPHTAKAVPLLAVLQAAGVPIDMHPAPGSSPKDKHRPVRIVIEASADDGYAVVFSLGELLPDVGHQAAWLALEEDGQPLFAKNQPANLIVPGDNKPARWVHGVTHLTAVDYAPPTTQP